MDDIKENKLQVHPKFFMVTELPFGESSVHAQISLCEGWPSQNATKRANIDRYSFDNYQFESSERYVTQ